MIVRENGGSWRQSLFTLRTSELADSWPRILGATLLAVVVTVVERGFHIETYSLTPVPFTIVGVALGIFLGFRNNTAYSRYWEARTLWGRLINESRSFARQTETLVDAPDAAAETALRREATLSLIAFAHALRHHLRGGDEGNLHNDVAPFLPAATLDEVVSRRHVPLALLQKISGQIGDARRKGWIDPTCAFAFEERLVALTDVVGGCERILNTPIPPPYTTLSHRLVAFFCFLLPFGITDSAGLFTPLVVFLVSQAFFGLDVIGTEVEEPFERRPHGLPLSAYCRTVEITLRESLGDRDLPAALTPVNGILL